MLKGSIKGIIIYLSILLSLSLLIGGGVLIYQYFIESKELLFEGVIIFSLGIMLTMIVMIASALGNTINLFGNIFNETTKISNKLSEQLIRQQKQQNQQNQINLFKGNTPGTMQITDLSSLINPLGPKDNNSEIINDLFQNLFKNSPKVNKSYNDLSDKELKEILEQAIKEDNFEKASEIKTILDERKKD